MWKLFTAVGLITINDRVTGAGAAPAKLARREIKNYEKSSVYSIVWKSTVKVMFEKFDLGRRICI
jgi:hypothetical protein